MQSNPHRSRLRLHQRDSRANSMTNCRILMELSHSGELELKNSIRILDRPGSPLNPQNLAPLSILQKLQVEALVEATLAFFALPLTRWSRGYLYELEVGVVGEIGAKGDTWQASWPPHLAEPPLSPRIPYLRASSDTCAEGLTCSM
jgi:hypothetical protein